MTGEIERQSGAPSGDEASITAMTAMLNHWKQQKLDAEAALSTFSPALFGREQTKIRQAYAGKSDAASMRAWFQRREELEQQRGEVVRKKYHAESEIQRLKSEIHRTKVAKSTAAKQAWSSDGGETPDVDLASFMIIRADGTLDRGGAAAQTLLELRRIRRLLEQLVAPSS